MDEDDSRLENLRGLPRQGQMMRIATTEAASTWAKSIQSLPQHVFKFALNATHDTLPHNSNLHLWKKRSSSSCQLCHQPDQNLIHVLNNCKVALDLRRYNERHDRVLQAMANVICLPQPPWQWICLQGIRSQPTSQLRILDRTLCGGTRIRRPLHWWS